jgi:3-hydroxyisobutyrate dehydrogenase-like beta-hydroxyacid dehydrogenase
MIIGFVGLGAMGSVMVGNLLDAGHPVRVWNRSPGPVRELTERGATAVADLAEIFTAEIVISMLANDAAVSENLLDDQLLAAAPEGAVHVNMATVSAELADRADRQHRTHGLHYVAAPVLGRVEVARAGNLTILAAGDSAAIAKAQPLFDVLGRRTWAVSDRPAHANLVKILGNYLVACSIEALAEATTVAEAAELDPTLLVDILTEGLFTGPVYQGYGAMIAARTYEPVAFRLALGRKDVELALDTARSHQVPLAFGSVLRDVFTEAVAHGQSDRDWAAVTETTRRHAGLDQR